MIQKPGQTLASSSMIGARLHVKETVALLTLAVLLPLAVHLLPPASGIPWGARLLPIFYAPFLGVVLFRLHVGLIPALLAPSLNALMTGLPGPELVILLTVEGLLFALIVHLLYRRWPRNWAIAPSAYVAALLLCGALIATVPLFAMFQPAASFVTSSLLHALPGLALLLLLNLLIVKTHPRRGG